MAFSKKDARRRKMAKRRLSSNKTSPQIGKSISQKSRNSTLKKHKLNNAFYKAAQETSPSHATVEAKLCKARVFMDFMRHDYPEIRFAFDLQTHHIFSFIDDRLCEVSSGTVANDLSAMRVMLRAIGREDIASDPKLTPKALGFQRDRSQGSKTHPSHHETLDLFSRAASLDVGIAAILKLELALGLRATEAIRSWKSLDEWAEALQRGEKLVVTFGTKGGRPRMVSVPDPAAAMAAITEAMRVTEIRGGRLLFGDFKKAFSIYRHAMSDKLHFQGHRLRYSFVLFRVLTYVEQGLSYEDALSATAEDCGHGAKRGRWMQRIYVHNRGLAEAKKLGADLGILSDVELEKY